MRRGGRDRDASDNPADASTDSIVDVGGDATGEVASDVSAGDASDFYVRMLPPDGGTMYPTIREALSAANASSAQNCTIHLGAGTYSEGEVFPLVLRNGLSLVGAGPSTNLLGTGPAGVLPPPVPRGSAAANDVAATILVGDAAKASTVAHLSIQSPLANAPGSDGIVCDRGTTAGPGPTPANTLIDDVTLDGFPIGLNVMSSPSPRSGCAARLTRSTVKNGSFGVVAAGWSSGYVQLVSVQLGDGTADGGNVFQNLQENPGALGTGAGLVSLDAVTGVQVVHNTFVGSDQAIWVAQTTASSPSSGMNIENNDIGSMTMSGFRIWGPTVISKLMGNTFHDVTTVPVNAPYVGPALALQSNGTPALPTVVTARGNSFFGNDVGVFVRSSDSIPSATVDFGTSTDPGGNAFRCNASPVPRNNGSGGDVIIALPNAAALHDPPRGQRLGSRSSGRCAERERHHDAGPRDRRPRGRLGGRGAVPGGHSAVSDRRQARRS